jgi:hypothetical protein
MTRCSPTLAFGELLGKLFQANRKVSSKCARSVELSTANTTRLTWTEFTRISISKLQPRLAELNPRRSINTTFACLARQETVIVLTDIGQTVPEYAEEIFSLGRELLTAVRQEPGQRPVRLHVDLGVLGTFTGRLLDKLKESNAGEHPELSESVYLIAQVWHWMGPAKALEFLYRLSD